MNSLLQHLVQTVLDVPSAAEAPEGPPPPQGSPGSFCDPRGWQGPVAYGELEPTEPRVEVLVVPSNSLLAV